MLILGHRGFRSDFPENTLTAFREAIKAGADGIELDVWLTKDNEVVISHDDYLEELGGSIKDADLKRLKSIELEKGESIPTLREVFESLPPDTIINVEIKDPDAVERTLEIIEDFGMKERVMISSFSIEALRRVRRSRGDLTCSWVVRRECIQ